MVFWNGTAQVLCAQGPAPADVAHLAELDLIPGDGLLPAVVPGAFDGWMRLVRDFGVLRLRDVLEPAIGYASQGFPVVAELAADVARHARRFSPEWPSSAEVWLRGGGPRAGTAYALPGLAAMSAGSSTSRPGRPGRRVRRGARRVLPRLRGRRDRPLLVGLGRPAAWR